MTILIASQTLSWLVSALLAVAVLSLARQIGVLHERIAPIGALTTDNGPQVGDLAPRIETRTLDGKPLMIGARRPSGRTALLMFVAPTCPICKKLIPLAKAFAQSERLDVIFVGDGDGGEQRKMVERFGLAGLPFVNSPEVGLQFHVGKLPYAVLIGDDGVIKAKGLVNSREHLESLVVAKETGFDSIQTYLRTQAKAPAAAE